MAITKAVWKFMFRKHSLRIATLVFCAVSVTAAAAMDRGQFKDVPPAIREWFENMRSPKGIACCSYADGHRTGYDIRQGQYWVPIDGYWYPVPPEAVIKTENPVARSTRARCAAQRAVQDYLLCAVGRRLISSTANAHA
jgi:hypothetical protein